MRFMWEQSSNSPSSKYHMLRPSERLAVCGWIPGEIWSGHRSSEPVSDGILDRMCPDCKQVWHIVCASIESATPTIQSCTSTTVLLGAYEIAEYVTLRNLLRSRLKKLGEIVPQ